MITIHKTTRFDKYLDALRKADKKGLLAAGRAELIVKNLTCMAVHAPEVKIKRTKNGELRVRNCQKYDLGSGYRLICVKEGPHLFLLYIGTHDECDRWLNNNRGITLALDSDYDTISFAEEEASLIPLPSENAEPDDIGEYEERLLEKIDDKTLRQIFRGICKE